MPPRPIQIDDLSDPRKLFMYLQEKEREIAQLRRDLIHTQAGMRSVDLNRLKAALELGGSHELDLTGLPGNSADEQNPLIPRVTSLPDAETTLYTAVVLIGSPDQLYLLDKESTPYVWRQVSTSPSNVWTTDSAQAIGPGAAKTLSDILTLGAGLKVTASGIDVDAGGVNVDAGGLTVGAGGANITGDTAVTGHITATGNIAASGEVSGVRLQVNGGVIILEVLGFESALTPAAVAANTTAEQTFGGHTGAAIGDTVIVNKPTAQAGLGIVGCRVSASDTIAITFCNVTGAAITPTAGETYSIFVIGW